MTPMQEQYREIKAKHPEDIVLFRLGDFYEAFNDDAETISRVLGITLTGRGKGENRVPMAGIPYHALDNYLPRLVKEGFKVAIVDQLTEPKPGQLVERSVTKIHTAGTLTEENTLDESSNNYIVCISVALSKKGDIYGVAFADVSTGLMQVFETSDLRTVLAEISRLVPSEIVVPNDVLDLGASLTNYVVTMRDAAEFDYSIAYKVATEQLGTKGLKGFGVEDMRVATQALGALINYIQECQLTHLGHLKKVRVYNPSQYTQLSETTIRNLELLFPVSGGNVKATLYGVMNKCATNMGKRKLRNWLLHPLLDTQMLQERLDVVDYSHGQPQVTEKIRGNLENIADIERIVGRVGVNSANARDLLGLASSIQAIGGVRATLSAEAKLPQRLAHVLSQIEMSTALKEVFDEITGAIHPEPFATLTEGHLIAPGYSTEVDELRNLRSGGKDVLVNIQQREIERTGITSLKVSYNKVFGYYIEVTKSHTSKVPSDYIRKQTLTNSERYITQELKDWEDKILTAQTKLFELEYQLFVQTRNNVAKHASELLHIGDLVAELDVLLNFGTIARQYRYVRPSVSSNKRTLKLTDGRHPVIEQLQESFTPNSCNFDASQQLVLLTGPNMSGKSTFIRQVALIVLMAQVGSFVPAKEMTFTPVDQIFTRVGASDNLSQGESTFMVEMHEAANILNNATDKSLIILDEVGRGTSTYDGVAIAWGIVEYLVENVRAFALFATHYHELIDLAKKYTQIKNYHVEVQESGDQVIFRHKISEGSTSKSYGVHVAQMAGVPRQVVDRANEILRKFEGNGDAVTDTSVKKRVTAPRNPKKIHPEQLGLLS